MIPYILHQIWVGPLQIPTKWMETWKSKNPLFKYMLWREKEISEFGLRFQDKVNYYVSKMKYSIASDIIRVEILDRLGGVYIDSDAICLQSIENALFMREDFFVGRDYDSKDGKYKNMLANGIIGSIPNHIVLKKYLEKIGQTRCVKYWKFGGRMMTDCVKGENITVLPICTFYPTNWNGKIAPIEGKIYATQMWGTTKGLYKKI